MKESLLKIFDSEIMYYVVIPIVIVLLGWVKNERDLKEKNKELGYWMLKCRKIPTFLQFTMPSGLHSVLERPFSEANGRPFLVKRSPLIVC